jgi:hypothetical protein
LGASLPKNAGEFVIRDLAENPTVDRGANGALKPPMKRERSGGKRGENVAA